MIRTWISMIGCALRRQLSLVGRRVYTDVLEQNQITANGDWRLSLIPASAWFQGFYVVWRMRRGTARVIREGCTFGEAIWLLNRYAVETERKNHKRDFQLEYGGVLTWGRRERKGIARRL